MSLSNPTLRALFTLVLAAAPIGCGHDDHDHAGENPNEEACEHFEKGPPAALTAAATSSADAPKINNDHKRYDVKLVDVAGGKGGFVAFAAGKAGDYIFFTDTAVQLTVKSSAMADVAAEKSDATIAECASVKGRHVYPLQVGTYVIGIGGATGDKVSFVVEAAEAH